MVLGCIFFLGSYVYVLCVRDLRGFCCIRVLVIVSNRLVSFFRVCVILVVIRIGRVKRFIIF